MRWTLVGCCWIALWSTVGCRSSRTDLLEAELRTRERQIRELHAELERAKAIGQAYQYELQTISPTSPMAEVCRPSGSTVVVGPIQEIELGRGTGGVDEDHIPGDEILLLVVVPRDQDGSEIKVPGSLFISVFEITTQGVKLPLSSWDIPNVELRPTWKSGLFSTGYHVRLSWKTPPKTNNVRAVVQLRLPSGEVYETDKDIKIRPPLGITRPPVVPIQPIEPTVPPPEIEELPFPSQLSSKATLLPPESLGEK